MSLRKEEDFSELVNNELPKHKQLASDVSFVVLSLDSEMHLRASLESLWNACWR